MHFFLVINKGISVVKSDSISGNHNNAYHITDNFNIDTFINVKTRIDSLFLSADSSFDTKERRNHCKKIGITLNVTINNRNNANNDDISVDKYSTRTI